MFSPQLPLMAIGLGGAIAIRLRGAIQPWLSPRPVAVVRSVVTSSLLNGFLDSGEVTNLPKHD